SSDPMLTSSSKLILAILAGALGAVLLSVNSINAPDELGNLCTGHDADEVQMLEHARGGSESGAALVGGARGADGKALPTAGAATGDTSPPPGAIGIAPYRDWPARRA